MKLVTELKLKQTRFRIRISCKHYIVKINWDNFKKNNDLQIIKIYMGDLGFNILYVFS